MSYPIPTCGSGFLIVPVFFDVIPKWTGYKGASSTMLPAVAAGVNPQTPRLSRHSEHVRSLVHVHSLVKELALRDAIRFSNYVDPVAA